MFRHSAVNIMLLALVGCTAVYASQYGAAPVAPAPISISYGAPAASDAVALQALGEAQASALSNAAGAAAASAKIESSKRDALDKYGHQIGVPLLARPYGKLTNLYAAALPPRSFVGVIEPEFVKDGYGGIKHIGEAHIGVIAI